MPFSLVRCVSCEDAEINQLQRRMAAALDEADNLRIELDALAKRLKLRDETELRLRLAKQKALKLTAGAMNPSYIQMGVINSPTDTVNALSFTIDGRYLASASDDKTVRVHDIERGLSNVGNTKAPPPTLLSRGKTTSYLSVMREGWLCVLIPPCEVIHEASSPVAVMEINESGDRLLVCAGADVLLFKKHSSGAWRYTDRLPRPAFGETENFVRPPTLATGVHFLKNDNECLIGYYHHGFWKCDINAWETTCIWGPDEKIGTSAKSPDSTSLVATNIRSGLDWFRNTSQDFKKIRHAAIMGTTKGYAVIFDAKHGRRIQTLKHGTDQSWVTALAYVESVPRRRRMIATGDGNCGQHTQILLWIEDKGTPAKVPSKLWVALPRLVGIQVAVIVTVCRIILVAMGITFALLLLFPSKWSVDDVSKMLRSPSSAPSSSSASSSASSSSVPPSPSPSPGGHSLQKTKFKEILDNLGEVILVCVS
ncbi:hypothetical protein C8R41DRAFT_927108 [Lentinula lateritia]|uniref:WD40 repeat-like protein n=1 Tax=Lentinula lateritia TaxID=40482 RepID=A0ABQ8UY29_9AGAR|nr:hypothetical protein C8R41DRAFT_927108 [Lentinula lateritia]